MPAAMPAHDVRTTLLRRRLVTFCRITGIQFITFEETLKGMLYPSRHTTSEQRRHDILTTSIQRCFNVECRLDYCAVLYSVVCWT